MASLVIAPGAITTVTLNRPDVRNAFDDGLIAAITEWARSVMVESRTRAVVLCGAGPVFCAGADLHWMARMVDYSREENLEDAGRAALMLQMLDGLPVPLIGRVQGGALGGGAGLAAICDVVVAADDAVFGFTETTLGIVPALIAPYVVRKIGFAAARELCLTGRRFTAARAKEIGLVTDVVPAAELDAAVDRHAQQVLKTAPSAVARIKALLVQVHGQPPADVIDLTVTALADQRVSTEGQEGMRAFLEKRAPAWTAAARPDGRPRSDPA
jgi:methylglutaconyl-CoA hydratase